MASDELQSKDGLPPAPETTGRTLYDAYTYTLSARGGPARTSSSSSSPAARSCTSSASSTRPESRR
jgi:hypothetical protein